MGALESIWTFILSYVKTVGIGDVLDIIIVAYLIYKILSIVRRTSAGGLIKGIVLLLAVMWLSGVLHLNVISYLLTQAMKMGVIVLVVLFQPEVRHILERFGNRSLVFRSNRRAKTGEAVIGLVVAVCCDMSKTKTGALIVFERSTGLAEYAATGTFVGASTSIELLGTIFFPKTPLHDGAVLIREGRIIAAGCMLPMSSNSTLSRELGMRHKAGIGISERSDAVSVIVSEETGSISVAVDGMLKRNLSRETFQKLLRKELLSVGEEGVNMNKMGARLRERLKKGWRA